MICFVSECGRVTTGGVAGSVPATAWGHVTVPPHYTHYTAHYTPNTQYQSFKPTFVKKLYNHREGLFASVSMFKVYLSWVNALSA